MASLSLLDQLLGALPRTWVQTGQLPAHAPGLGSITGSLLRGDEAHTDMHAHGPGLPYWGFLISAKSKNEARNLLLPIWR